MQGKWLEDFALKYKHKIGLPFVCNARAELVTEKNVAYIKNAGCIAVWIGVEAGDEVVRKELLNRNNTDSVTINCVRLLQNAEISIVTENILGLPETSIADDFKTLELNRMLKPSYANPSIYQPYPGTALGDHAQIIGEFSGNYTDIKDFFSDSGLNLKHKRELANLNYLFSFCVEYHHISPWLLNKLIRLPFMRLPFQGIYLLWKRYALTNRIFSMKLNLKQWFHIIYRVIFR